ncbi:MAG: YqaA family protein [Paracoccaceae bacterium]|tara:strand:- start:224 stop:832 length:609 start_codon:yes stop_codon:yes gene_type:complete
MIVHVKDRTSMIKNLYNKTMALAGHPQAIFLLGAVSFIEASFFPIPPDVMLIPMVLMNPSRAWLFALVATAFSVLGGIFGYIIGTFSYEHIAEPLLYSLGKEAQMVDFSNKYNEIGFWAVITAGISPIPYKVVTIMSGATNLNFAVFLGASMASRGVRFFVVAGLLHFYGHEIRDFIERYLNWVFMLFVILLVVGFIGFKLI